MQTEKKPNMLTRNDTILGVCQALGDDFGFNPTWLRIALILPLFWFPLEIIALYFGLGLVVFLSRTFAPATVADKKVAALPFEANEDAPELSKAA